MTMSDTMTSYLIYSEESDALPAHAKDYVYRTLAYVLGGGSEGYTHLTDEDRCAIRDILLDTKSEFVRY